MVGLKRKKLIELLDFSDVPNDVLLTVYASLMTDEHKIQNADISVSKELYLLTGMYLNAVTKEILKRMEK